MTVGYRMYRGEYFAMQVDAHVRFVQNWDTDVISQWYSCHNEMSVITVYPSALYPKIENNGERIDDFTPVMCDSDFEETDDDNGEIKYLRHGQMPEREFTNSTIIQPFWGAGFSFARGHFIINVPYDQYLPMVFQGEEINIGIRGFTYGYDYYRPTLGIVYHRYKRNEMRPTFIYWQDNSNKYPGASKEGYKRLVSIIQMTPFNKTIPDWNQSEKEKYGLGNVRPLSKFLETFGIHLDTMTIEYNLCHFAGDRMQKIFIPALRKDGMGLDYNKIHFKYKNKLKNNQNQWIDDNSKKFSWKDDFLNFRLDDDEYRLEVNKMLNSTIPKLR